MPDPIKAGLPAGFHKRKIKDIYCLLAAVLFAVGILGNLPPEYLARPVSPVGVVSADLQENFANRDAAYYPEKSTAEEEVLPTPEELSGRAQEKYTAARTLQGVDDFRLEFHTNHTGPNVFYRLRLISVLPLIRECRQLFCPGFRGRRLWQRLKRIRLFHVILFIHRTDGKKKSCFA